MIRLINGHHFAYSAFRRIGWCGHGAHPPNLMVQFFNQLFRKCIARPRPQEAFVGGRDSNAGHS